MPEFGQSRKNTYRSDHGTRGPFDDFDFCFGLVAFGCQLCRL